ncbi:hypothetical protein [Actinomyces dentalis]|uniref:hypothetical protein n=2 Tax=Actinomyces dentalis TaxID=272548 RepID=UPI00235420EC|nr:hypothetical protein [Actinomyces dentalis]
MLLVHVAGTADLGIPLIVGGRSRPRQETAELTARRAAELDAARTGGRAADLLLGLRFTQKDPRADDAAGPAPGSAPPAAAPAPSGGAPPAAAPGSALRKELGALARLAGEPGTSSEDIDILIVGVEGGSTPTDSIARALVGALRRASAQVRDLVAGRRARVLDACILPDLQVSRASIETLERAIGGHDGHVLLALAGGATTVFAEVAGVVAATHGDEWSLALIDRAGDDRADGAAPILRMSVDGEDPLRGWLMGLGLPTVLAQEYDGRGAGAQAGGEMPDEVRRAAGALRRAVGETPVEGGIGPEDFAQLLWTDTARGDLAAGMALRAWVAAEYRRRRRQYLDRTGLDEAEHPDALRKGGELGRAIGRLEKKASTRPLAAPEVWLVAQRDFIDLGIGATHRFDEAGDDLRERVRGALGGPPPDWLSWPSGTVCLLTAQGQPRGRGRGPERDPIAVALLRAQPDPALRRACSVPGPLTLRTFIACSDDSLGEGRGVVDRLAAGDVDHHPDWEPPGADGATARSYGRAATSDGVTASGAEESMSRAGRLAAQWLEDQLEERWSRPRAIVVTVVGEKPVVIALLRAAQVFGARHGIAVLLASTVRSADGQNVLQFHQFGLDRDVRRALLRATGYCLDRLDLLTAARLLALGDPAMEESAGEARALADELVRAVQTEDIDGCAGVILGVMGAVGRMIDHVQPDAQARLATIIGELLNPAPESKRTGAFREPRILALADGRFDQQNSVYTSDDADLADEGAGALLRLLVRVRNKVTINHGSKGLSEATEQVLSRYRRESRCTYARLVERAVTAVESNSDAGVGSGSGAVAGDWGRRLDALRKRVGALEEVSYG